MPEISPRIVGTEMEWSISERYKGSERSHRLEHAHRVTKDYLAPSIVATGNGSMLSNGARYYEDYNNFLEYATPEDTLIEHAIAAEFAGERIVIDSLARYLQDNDKIDHFKVMKRAADETGVSWGYHVNLSADRNRIHALDDSSLHLLGLHLATSQPILGSGNIFRAGHTGKAFHYSFGQKLIGLRHDYQAGTTGTSKGLINTRDEPHAPNQDLYRIHITSMDPHVSPWAAKLALGSCSLILRAIEQNRGKWLRADQTGSETPLLDVALINGTDLGFSRTVMLEDGRSITPTDIQQELVELAEQTEHTDEEAVYMAQWRKAVEDLSEDPFKLVDRSDAIAKLSLIQKIAQRHDENPFDMSSNRARATDVYCSTLAQIDENTIASPHGLFDSDYYDSMPHKLRTQYFAADNPSEDDIIDAVYTPPTTTRAHGRGAAIGSGRVVEASWHRYRYSDGTIQNIDNPYKP